MERSNGRDETGFLYLEHLNYIYIFLYSELFLFETSGDCMPRSSECDSSRH